MGQKKKVDKLKNPGTWDFVTFKANNEYSAAVLGENAVHSSGIPDPGFVHLKNVDITEHLISSLNNQKYLSI